MSVAHTLPPADAPRGFTRQRTGHWRESLTLADGRELVLRPIEPDDTPALQRAFAKLEPEEVRLRFLHPMSELTDAYARELCTLDPKRAFALVIAEPGIPGIAEIGAVARLAFEEPGGNADFAIIVGHPLAGNGLGRHMLRRLIDWSRRRGLKSLQGDVLNDNLVMLHLAHRLGFTQQSMGEPGLVRICRPLQKKHLG
ncbi:MAG: GNAT family N-acetyltransferase [Ahniella sp.]|nr:GNAT family N-acetyltransferase [Ahniella sp.]